MTYTLYTQDGCPRCERVKEALLARGATVEVLTHESLCALPDPMRRADLMTLIQMRERDDLPVVFRDDVLVEIEAIGLLDDGKDPA